MGGCVRCRAGDRQPKQEANVATHDERTKPHIHAIGPAPPCGYTIRMRRPTHISFAKTLEADLERVRLETARCG
jgi:hypothetical protein